MYRKTVYVPTNEAIAQKNGVRIRFFQELEASLPVSNTDLEVYIQPIRLKFEDSPAVTINKFLMTVSSRSRAEVRNRIYNINPHK